METFGEEKSKPRKTTPQKELEDKDNHKKTDIPNKVSKKFVSFVVRTSKKERNIIMKGLNVLAAFLGGAAVGAASVSYLLLKKEKTPVTKSQKFSVRKGFV